MPRQCWTLTGRQIEDSLWALQDARERAEAISEEETMFGDLAITPKSRLGQTVITANANSVLPELDVVIALQRHQSGDWGDVDDHDRKENEYSLQNGARLVSIYKSVRGQKFYIVTEWDRSATTVLLPEDY